MKITQKFLYNPKYQFQNPFPKTKSKMLLIEWVSRLYNWAMLIGYARVSTDDPKILPYKKMHWRKPAAKKSSTTKWVVQEQSDRDFAMP